MQVNDLITYKSIIDPEEMNLCQQDLLNHVLTNVPKVRDRVAGQNVLRSSLTNAHEHKICLDIYTLNDEALKLKKKADKERRLQNRQKSLSKSSKIISSTLIEDQS